jgi:Holliday junction resolvase
MSGLSSLRKGKRVEYEIRDELRALGYIVDRIPASGNSQGFKGDLRVIDPKTQATLVVEVKARKSEFKLIYELLATLEYVHTKGINGEADITASHSFRDMFIQPTSSITAEEEVLTEILFVERIGKRHFTKLRTLKKYFKNCDILVVKDDRKPPIYLRYV